MVIQFKKIYFLQDVQQKEWVEMFLRRRFEASLKEEGAKMSSIYMVDEKYVQHFLAVITRMDYSMFRHRIFKIFENQNGRSEIVNQMTGGILHPSDLIQLWNTAPTNIIDAPNLCGAKRLIKAFCRTLEV